MTTKDKATRRKLSLLELAQEMSNVSRACRIMGYSRQQFYEIRRNYQTYGVPKASWTGCRVPGGRIPTGSLRRWRPPSSPMPWITPPTAPCGFAQELSLQGGQVSSGGVRGVWSRHKLLTKQERLLRLEKTTCERQIEINPEQIRLLERFSPEFRERHIHTRHTGDLVSGQNGISPDTSETLQSKSSLKFVWREDSVFRNMRSGFPISSPCVRERLTRGGGRLGIRGRVVVSHGGGGIRHRRVRRLLQRQRRHHGAGRVQVGEDGGALSSPSTRPTAISMSVKDFSARVMARNKDTEVHVYQGTKKRFDVEDGPAFDAGAARLAHRRTVDFLNRRL